MRLDLFIIVLILLLISDIDYPNIGPKLGRNFTLRKRF